MTLHGYCAGDGRPDAMDGQWMTYTEAAVRLGVSLEAARRRAIRGKWPRMPGNDGRTRVQVPDELHPLRTPDVRGTESEAVSEVVSALKSHIETLKADIERLTAERQADRDELAVARSASLAQPPAVLAQPSPVPAQPPAIPARPSAVRRRRGSIGGPAGLL